MLQIYKSHRRVACIGFSKRGVSSVIGVPHISQDIFSVPLTSKTAAVQIQFPRQIRPSAGGDFGNG
jgi:hypothetical protein